MDLGLRLECSLNQKNDVFARVARSVKSFGVVQYRNTRTEILLYLSRQKSVGWVLQGNKIWGAMRTGNPKELSAVRTVLNLLNTVLNLSNIEIWISKTSIKLARAQIYLGREDMTHSVTAPWLYMKYTCKLNQSGLPPILFGCIVQL